MLPKVSVMEDCSNNCSLTSQIAFAFLPKDQGWYQATRAIDACPTLQSPSHAAYHTSMPSMDPNFVSPRKRSYKLSNVGPKFKPKATHFDHM